MICQNCGSEIMDDAKFCSYCGKPVSDDGDTPDLLDQLRYDDLTESEDSFEREIEEEFQSELKAELHQEFDSNGYLIENKDLSDEDPDFTEDPDINDDDSDLKKAYRIVDFDMESGMLTVKDRDGNELFSAECEMPGKEKRYFGFGVVKTFYYIPDFIIYKHGCWKIFDLQQKKHFAVRAVQDDEESRIISEFDSVEISDRAVIYSSEGKVGLLSAVSIKPGTSEEDDMDTSQDAAYSAEQEAKEKYVLVAAADCVYDSIERIKRSTFAGYSFGPKYFKAISNQNIYIINEKFGLITDVTCEEDENGDGSAPFVYIAVDANDDLHVASDGEYKIYGYSDISECYGDEISYCSAMPPSASYSIKECTDENSGSFIVYDIDHVKNKKMYGVIKNAKFILAIDKDWIEAVSYNALMQLFIVRINGTYGVYSEFGETVIPPRFTSITPAESENPGDDSDDVDALKSEFDFSYWNPAEEQDRKFVACDIAKKYLVTVKMRYERDVYPWETEYEEIMDTKGRPASGLEDVCADEGAEYFFSHSDFEYKSNNARFDRDNLTICKDDNDELSFAESDDIIFDFGDKEVQYLDMDLTSGVETSEQDIVVDGHIAIFKDDDQWKIYDTTAEEFLYSERNFIGFKQYGKVLIYAEEYEPGKVLFGVAYYNSETEDIRLITDPIYKFLEAKALDRSSHIVLRGRSSASRNHFIGTKGLYASDSYSLGWHYIGQIFYIDLFGTSLHVAYKDNYEGGHYYIELYKHDKPVKLISSSKLIHYYEDKAESSKYIFWCVDENDNLKRICLGKAEEYGKCIYKTGETGKASKNEGKIIIRRDGYMGMVNLYGEILIPFRFSAISPAELHPETDFILDDFGRKGFAVVDGEARYVIPCEYESIELLKGGKMPVIFEEEYIAAPIKPDEEYIKVEKMGRSAYYTRSGKLAVHFSKI